MTGEQVRTKIWVISLPTAESRRAQFAQSAWPNAAFSFWDAQRELTSDLTYDALQTPGNYGRPLQPQELGCYASHYSLWRWLVSSEYEQMIVLEDDTVCDWKFLQHICERRLSDEGIEYLRLFSKMPGGWRFVASPYLDRYHHLVAFKGYVLGTQAYVLTRKGATKFLSRGSSVTAPVDVYMDRYWEHGVLNLGIHPSCVFERYQTSSIGDDRLEQHRLTLRGRFVRNFFLKSYRRFRLLWNVYGMEPRDSVRTRRALKMRPHL